MSTFTSKPKPHKNAKEVAKATSKGDELSEIERQYILLTQNGLPLIPKPYDWLAKELNLSVDDVLEMTNNFLDTGVIRRIAAVPNHYKLGYKFNGMTVWDVKDEDVSALGHAVGKLPFVSHCYLRPRHLPHWHYNLFAMVHGKTSEEIDEYRVQIKDLLCNSLQDLTQQNNEDCTKNLEQTNDMLVSTKILKKTGLRLKK